MRAMSAPAGSRSTIHWATSIAAFIALARPSTSFCGGNVHSGGPIAWP